MRLNKCKGIIFGLCLCVSVFGASCGNQPAVEPDDREGSQTQEPAIEPEDTAGTPAAEPVIKPAGMENNPVAEPVIKPEGMEKNQAGASLKITEIMALPSYSIVDVAGFEQASIHALFYAQEITDDIYARIDGCSYQENEEIGLEELRYLRVLHMGIDGKTHVGELIVHEEISQDILEILEALYEAGYPIEKMMLVDHYDGDDVKSMEDNNTSAFNYRTIAGTDKRSNHSYGMAIDINPRYNPYVKVKSDGSVLVSPDGGKQYADRAADFPYKIERGGFCYNLFVEHGFEWGGDWTSVKDYQHFEKSRS